ncbi:hypothetical protein Tco_0156527 [Tanacetum coccineum]
MSDSEDSTVTYTEISSPYEDLSDIGSPGAEGPIFQDPPSPDYVPGPEEPEQAPPSPIYIPFVPEPVYPEFLPVDDEVFPAEEQPMPAADSPTHQSPGYIPESDPEEDPEEDDEEDPEEDPADYPADRGDRDDEESSDDDDAEEEHLSCLPTQQLMSIRPQASAPFLSEEVAERLLALPTPPPSPLSPYSSPLPQIPSPPLPIPSPPPNGPTYVEGSLGSRAAGIRQRDALPSPVHETEMPEICLPLRQMRAAAPSTYHSLLPSGTPPLLPIPLPSTSHIADIPEADTPPRKRLPLTTPRPECEVDVCTRESSEFCTRHHDAQKDRAAVRAEIEVLRRERLAYEQESMETRQALAKSEAHCRALEARVTVLETEVHRHEWQRQATDDLAVQHIMRTQALEAGARIDTLEDTGSSS